jgi:hypothetical protein
MPIKIMPFELDDDSTVLIGNSFRGTSGKRPGPVLPEGKPVAKVIPKPLTKIVERSKKRTA